MSKRVFSDAILAKIGDSAICYAQEITKRKSSLVDVIDRLSAITGIQCSKGYATCNNCLGELIQQLEVNLQGEQIKAREDTTRYDFHRHIELHSLRNHLKKEHSKLLACCATNKLR